jgi:hypothetical protein
MTGIRKDGYAVLLDLEIGYLIDDWFAHFLVLRGSNFSNLPQRLPPGTAPPDHEEAIASRAAKPCVSDRMCRRHTGRRATPR